MKNPFTLLSACVALLAGLCAPLHAATYTDTTTGVVYTYTVSGTSATLTAVELPSGVTSLEVPSTIGDYKVIELGEQLFAYESTLTSVTLPSTLETIGDDAFYGTANIDSLEIPASVTSIGYDAFGDSGFTSLSFLGEPPTDFSAPACGILDFSIITYPKEHAPAWQVALYGASSVADEAGNTLWYNETSTGEAELSYVSLAENTTSLTLPSTIGESGLSVTSLKDGLLRGKTALTSVSLPDTVEVVPSGLLHDCRALTSVTLPSSLGMISKYAFSGCEKLPSISFPSTLVSIGRSAFDNCEALTSVSFAEGLTSIGDQAFYSCATLTSVSLPESLSSLGDFVFSYCYNLSSVNLPSQLTSIGNYLFLYCVRLQKLEIPSKVTSIGVGAFAYTAFSSLTLPASIETIADDAFYNSLLLTSVTFLGEPPTMGETVFGANQKSITGTYLATTEWVAELDENTDTTTGLWNEISMQEVTCSLPEGVADEAAVKTRILAALEGQSAYSAIEVSGTSTTIQDCMDLGISPSVSVTDSSAAVAFEAPTLEVTGFDLATKTLTFKVVPGTNNTLTQLPAFSNVKLYSASSLSETMQEVTSEVTADTASYLSSGSKGTFTLTLSDTLPAFLQLRINE